MYGCKLTSRELPSPPHDAYLIRAILRTAVRSMSIYTSRLESLLLPALTDPTFVQPLNLHAATANPLNPAQTYALSIAHAAWETCEVLEQMLETGQWPKFVADTLRPTMDKFDLIVGKVIHPMLTAFKRDLLASLTRNDGISPPSGKVVGLPSVPVPNMGPPPVPANKEYGSNKITKEPSERGQVRQLAVPLCFQHFASRVDAGRKVLEMIAGPCQDDGEGWITGVLVPVIWKGICTAVHKDLAGGARPPSPAAVSKALQSVGKEKDSLPTVVHSPSLGGVTAKLTSSLSILPSRSASRPPSPTRGMKYDTRTLALIALEGLIKRMLGNLVPPPSGEPVTEENITEHLAREALHEALESLESLRIVSSAMCSPSPSARMLSALRRVRDEVDDVNEEALDDAIEDMNSVILFTMLINQANTVLPSDIRLKAPHETFGRGAAEYDRIVMNGFSTAEEWAKRVAVGIKSDIERVMGEIKEHGCGDGVGAEWVRCLALALDARAQIRVST
jgi:hypothetical protein